MGFEIKRGTQVIKVSFERGEVEGVGVDRKNRVWATTAQTAPTGGVMTRGSSFFLSDAEVAERLEQGLITLVDPKLESKMAEPPGAVVSEPVKPLPKKGKAKE